MQGVNIYHKIAFLFEYPQKETLEQILKISKENSIKISPEEVEIQYTKLFINHYPHTIAPPFASSYIGKSDEVYDYVEEFYKISGYKINSREFPPDYLIYELVFLGNLYDEKNSEKESEFLENHFISWFSKFVKRIVESKESEIYSLISRESLLIINNRLKELKSGEENFKERIF